MISTCMLSLRTGIIPRWMAFLGLALALFLLFSLGFFYWAPLVFPLWVHDQCTHPCGESRAFTRRERNRSLREDNGAGLGASHQTGWTGTIARLLDLFGRVEATDALTTPTVLLEARLVQEQVGGKE